MNYAAATVEGLYTQRSRRKHGRSLMWIILGLAAAYVLIAACVFAFAPEQFVSLTAIIAVVFFILALGFGVICAS